MIEFTKRLRFLRVGLCLMAIFAAIFTYTGAKAALPLPTLAAAPTTTVGTAPTATPSTAPTATHTSKPTAAPTATPTAAPTATPFASPKPSVTICPLPTAKPFEASTSGGTSASVTVTGTKLEVDFDYLRTTNIDTVGWLLQPESGLSYPIMHRVGDPLYYAKHTYNEVVNGRGTIFLDGASSPDYSDPISYLLGNGREKNGIFATLFQYKAQNYYDCFPSMRLLTPYGDFQVDFFAGQVASMSKQASWRIAELPQNAAAFEATVSEMRADSVFRCYDASLPVWGDRLVALVAYYETEKGECFVLYGRMRPIEYTSNKSEDLCKIAMDDKPTGNGYVQVGPLGKKMIYAQNDELFNRMRFESNNTTRFRVFGQGGCGPTAVAIAIANVVDKTELEKLGGYAASDCGYTFCESSVNSYFCKHPIPQYQLQTADEYLRYFPIAIANFAAGNNLWEFKFRKPTTWGTDMSYLSYLCNIYDIKLTMTRKISEALEALKQDGRMAISCTINGGPFTNTSHYVVLAGVDETYFYVLDPYRRSNYNDMRMGGIIEQISPGVLRIKLEDVMKCNLSPIYILEKNGPS